MSRAPPFLPPWWPVRWNFVTVAAALQWRQTPPVDAVVLMRQRMGGTGSRLAPKYANRSLLVAARLTTSPPRRHLGDRSFRAVGSAVLGLAAKNSASLFGAPFNPAPLAHDVDIAKKRMRFAELGLLALCSKGRVLVATIVSAQPANPPHRNAAGRPMRAAKPRKAVGGKAKGHPFRTIRRLALVLPALTAVPHPTPAVGLPYVALARGVRGSRWGGRREGGG